jgi:hypothetical protein
MKRMLARLGIVTVVAVSAVMAVPRTGYCHSMA